MLDLGSVLVVDLALDGVLEVRSQLLSFFCFYLNKIWTELQDNSIGTILLLVAMGCAMHSAVLV